MIHAEIRAVNGTDDLPPGLNGVMPLQLGDREVRVWGGPFRNRPKGVATYGVKMAAEIKDPADLSVSCKDFGVPDPADMRDAVVETLNQALDGEQIYVGCMGGIGRTGTFMASLAKAAGENDPVAYVRSTYLEHAVETKAQEQFVADLPVDDIRVALKSALWWRRFAWLKPYDFLGLIERYSRVRV
jgi:hypothetical protein